MAGKAIYVVDGARTPFLKSRNLPGPFSASDLAVAAGRTLLARQPFAASDLDEVILGSASPSVDEINIGRVAALRLGCGHKVPGWTVMRNCASGMQALDSAVANIQAGRSQLVLAGGADALSRAIQEGTYPAPFRASISVTSSEGSPTIQAAAWP